MTTLFSPIGTADPITQLGDGPMLHIVRHRAPSKVVLFLSPAMAAHQDADGRYTRAIEMLCEEQCCPVPTIELVRSDFDEVYRFDHYIAEFEKVLEVLSAESGTEPVLVNASSGTPAMEQALVALGSFGRLNLKLLQVTTPRHGVNARHDREDPNAYDLQEMWEWNQSLRESEGEAADACRIVEVETPNFADRLLRENVIAMVERFEYEAAYELACEMTSIDPKAREMIRAAADRLNLNGSLPARVFAGTELAFKANDLLSEHLYLMEARLAQGHWADFVRLVTPALTKIAEQKLRPYLPESKYLKMEKGRPSSTLDFEVIRRDPVLYGVLGRYDSGPSYITNDILVRLINRYCPDEVFVEPIRALRTMERDCRNKLAHEICPVSKQLIEKIGGLPLETAMRYLFELHGNMKPGLYRRISQAIVDLM